jgi:putative DNA primase/helicase
MITTGPCKAYAPSTLTDHIQFGDVGVGSDGERYIKMAINVGEEPRDVLMPYDGLVGGSRAALAQINREGAHLISPKAAAEFLQRLQALGPQEPSFRVATRVGPFGDVFVLPETVISARNETVATWFDDNCSDYLSWGREGGTLKGWRGFERLALGNSRLILAIGVAFVGPLRLITPIEPVAYQQTGPGGTGKTTLGSASSSAWGQRLLRNLPHPLCAGDAWNNTLNNLERVLAMRDHTLLFLNEGHHVSAKDLVAAIFLICEGQGKGRYTEASRWEWFVPVFSTSNDSVADVLQKAGEPLARAAFDRLIDIPMPESGFGVFENLHGSATISDFAVRLKSIYDAHYGVVGRDYVFKILQELDEDRDGLAAWVQARRVAFMTEANKCVSADPNHARVISHFATVFAALRLADRFELFCLPKGCAGKALLACLRDHLRVTDGVTARVAAARPEALLKAYVLENRARFVTLGDRPLPRGHVHANCLGYVYESGGRTWYGFSAALLESVLGGRGGRDELCRQLDRLGLVRKVRAGKGETRYATRVKIGSAREYLLSFDSSVFD